MGKIRSYELFWLNPKYSCNIYTIDKPFSDWVKAFMAHEYIQNLHLCLSMHMSTFKSIYLENDKKGW